MKINLNLKPSQACNKKCITLKYNNILLITKIF